MAKVNYFKNVSTLEDVRIRLIENLKDIDPKSGKFKTMISQYEKSCETFGKNHVTKKGKMYESEVAIKPDEFGGMIMRILALDGVETYMDGTWLWVKGETKKHRKELTEIGRELAGKGSLRYSGKRGEWWFADQKSA